MKKKGSEASQIILVASLSIGLACFSVYIQFIEKVYDFFLDNEVLLVGEFLANYAFLYLAGLLLLTYRRWRKAQAKQKELENIIESINPDALVVVDSGNRITMCNPSIRRIFGYDMEEVVNRTTDTLFAEQLPKKEMFQEVHKGLEEEGFHISAATGRTKSGQPIDLEVITGNLRRTDGAVLLIRDVTLFREIEKKHRRGKEMLRLVTDNMDDLVAVLDTEGRRLYNSPSYKKLFDDLESLKGTDSFDEIHPDDREMIKRVFRETVETGVGKRAEFRFLLGNGDERSIESQGSTIKDDEGRVANVIVVSRDITDRKKAEQNLIKASKEWSATFDSIQDAIMILDKDFRIIRANQSAGKILEMAMDRLPGTFCYDLVHEDGRPPDGCPHMAMRATGRHAEKEIYQARNDRWYLVTVDPVFDAEGGISGSIHTMKDITDRRRSEAALRLSEERYRGIFQATPEGRLISVNPALARMAGYESPRDMIESVADVRDLLAKSEGERSFFLTRLNGEADVVRNLEVEHARRDGSLFWASVNARVVKDEDGHILYYEGTLEDITERKATADSLRRLLAEVEEKNRELHRVYEELQASEAVLVQTEKMASLGLLSAGVAHELKNPLGVILQGVAYVQSSVGDEALIDACERVSKSAVRANSVVENLLNFARQTPPSLEDVALCALVDEALGMVEHQMSLKKIEMVRNFPSDRCLIRADANQIREVFINVLINALDAIQGGGTISVTITPVSAPDNTPWIETIITDTGTGIPEEFLPKVFDPFFTTKDVGKGTGIGLSVTKGIVERHGGRITIDSRMGAGTTVKVTLPCSLSEKEGDSIE